MGWIVSGLLMAGARMCKQKWLLLLLPGGNCSIPLLLFVYKSRTFCHPTLLILSCWCIPVIAARSDPIYFWLRASKISPKFTFTMHAYSSAVFLAISMTYLVNGNKEYFILSLYGRISNLAQNECYHPFLESSGKPCKSDADCASSKGFCIMSVFKNAHVCCQPKPGTVQPRKIFR